jgi:uncharacterized protein YjbJ (UPF0337 family)
MPHPQLHKIQEVGSMNKDRVKGTINEVVGSAKRKAGELTGDTKLQVGGMAQQMKGKVENTWGKTKDVVREAINNTEVHVDAHVKLGGKNSTPDTEDSKYKGNPK